MHYLELLPQNIRQEEIIAIHSQRQRWVNQEKKGFLRYRRPYLELQSYRARHLDCSSDVVTIGLADEVGSDDRMRIRDNLRQFMPWRKGPFSVFGIEIDAEWRSERKWNHLLPALPELAGKLVADIGANNGYYMFRMAPYKPRLVLGFEPSVQHYYCFQALKSISGVTNLESDLLGVEHLSFFPCTFDVVFLMGIIYHRPSPIDTLRDILSALVPGGTLLLETQAIPGDEPYALFPAGTYAKVPGTYFVPTAACLHNWLEKAGFIEVEMVARYPMSSEEQRRTEWMCFESYADFIDSANEQLTVEGYPAPLRLIFKAVRKA